MVKQENKVGDVWIGQIRGGGAFRFTVKEVRPLSVACNDDGQGGWFETVGEVAGEMCVTGDPTHDEGSYVYPGGFTFHQLEEGEAYPHLVGVERAEVKEQ